MSDIPNTEYITINKDGIFVGGKLTTTYRGEKIARINDVKEFFTKIQDECPEIKELHVGAFKTMGRHAGSGLPSGRPGLNAWCRVKLSDGCVGPWRFVIMSSLASLCAYNCVYCYACLRNMRCVLRYDIQNQR